ncbi:amino acid/polyamine/organocation transporter, APC superfamily [Marininema mesophilum]|uniref:Amino acid/polyamine/organocation transporter, APC superfamily n=1 Tax=Marininema mesophilum TaxID=1048340 RepID=A0A1H2Z207_9BACL|nr:APC family permease [Marininema mesophilum]SDX11473.1 amino acid/polyamine/organocation transporter, APC superfamily [Marininema mesophilum]
MKRDSIGTFTLSGLMVGPVLGSGIILLPPLLYQQIGDYAIIAWTLMLIFSGLFARLFARMSIAWPGDGGLSIAVKRAFGSDIEKLAAWFQILAACVGPIALFSTAGEFISTWFHGNISWREEYGMLLLILSLWILSTRLSYVGRLALVLSTSASVVLLLGSFRAIPSFREGSYLDSPFHGGDFGYGLLLLFWAIVGWEIVGNYSLEVKDRERTIPRAVRYSLIVVALVSLATAASVQWIDPTQIVGVDPNSPRLVIVLYSLLGTWTVPIITLITVGLCISTFLLVVGGTARLISAQAAETPFHLLTRRTKQGVPFPAILTLATVQFIIFIITNMGWITLDHVVAIANAFFIGNALCGILAAYRLFSEWGTRVICLLLSIAFLALLTFTPLWVWGIMLTLTLYANRRALRNRSSLQQKHGTPCEPSQIS